MRHLNNTHRWRIGVIQHEIASSTGGPGAAACPEVATPADHAVYRTHMALLGFLWAPFLLFGVDSAVGEIYRRFAVEMGDAHARDL